MLLFGFLIFMYLDSVMLLPLQTCNAYSKEFLYIFDCQDEFKEQVHFMDTTTEYFKSNTEYEAINVQFSAGNTSIWNFNDLTSEIDCKELLSMAEVMQLSNVWEQKKSSKCEFYLSIIFIHNITSEDEKFINEIVESELKMDIAITRFFIIGYSELKVSMDYIYYTPSFKDLKIEDIFPQICDLIQVDHSFTYSSDKYFNSKYFIAKQLQNLSVEDAICYCRSRHVGIIIGLETYEEVLYIFEIILNLFTNNSTHEIHIYIDIFHNQSETNMLVWRSGSPFAYFLPSHYEKWKGCFYLKLTNRKSFRLLADEFYNLGNSLEKIDCYTKFPNTLVVCEDDAPLDMHQWFLNQLIKGAENHWVVDTDSFTDFINQLFNLLNNIEMVSSFTYGDCNVKTNTSRNLLESFLCANTVVNVSNSDKNVFIYILSEEQEYFYTFKTVDISKCDNYNECQVKMNNKTDKIKSTKDVTLFCSNEREVHQANGQCSAQVINVNQDLEYFQCKTNRHEHFYKCIKDPNGHCSDNSNLLNCENFTCPEPFFKCFNSYCVFPFVLLDKTFDCILGDDENYDNTVTQHHHIATLSFVLRDLCIDSNSFNDLSVFIKGNNFTCTYICPQNYNCLSSRTVNKDINKTDTEINVAYYTFSFYIIKAFDVFDIFHQDYELLKLFPVIFFVEFYGRGCEIFNFDQEFHNWSFDKLLILDLSINNLTHSTTFKSIESFNQLKYLNLSQNIGLVIDHNFTFPRFLEIIDLSYTNISALKPSVFYSLTYLRHLNLSFTLINTFKDMGIPINFKLDTLFIEGLLIKFLEIDFFRRLSIEFELRASDYVMCCPQVLNPNIDVNKCFAPLDIISTCKHLVGDTLKRIVVWIVGILTLLANILVLTYRIGWNREIFKKAYGLFITGLAVSDLFMGAYLIIIAIVDLYYTNVYVLKDFAWRNGFLCQVLGILSTLSSEASSFFICLITLDRFLSITYPFGEHRFSKTITLISFTLVWLVSFVIALVPVVVSDWDIYSSNGLCLALPFSSKLYKGWIFSFVIYVVLNFLLCTLIVVGQLIIFISLINNNTSNEMAIQNNLRRSQEKIVARKLAFVALTDFSCWFPVGILGILSLYGYIFNREVYAWIAVFVLPINSALNPIIYTLPALYTFIKRYINT